MDAKLDTELDSTLKLMHSKTDHPRYFFLLPILLPIFCYFLLLLLASTYFLTLPRTSSYFLKIRPIRSYFIVLPHASF